MRGFSMFLGIKNCGLSKLWVLKIYGYLKLWVLKIVGTELMAPQKFVWVLKILSLCELQFVSIRNLWVHIQAYLVSTPLAITRIPL